MILLKYYQYSRINYTLINTTVLTCQAVNQFYEYVKIKQPPAKSGIFHMHPKILYTLMVDILEKWENAFGKCKAVE